jgi:hypothetical protein
MEDFDERHGRQYVTLGSNGKEDLRVRNYNAMGEKGGMGNAISARNVT